MPEPMHPRESDDWQITPSSMVVMHSWMGYQWSALGPLGGQHGHALTENEAWDKARAALRSLTPASRY